MLSASLPPPIPDDAPLVHAASRAAHAVNVKGICQFAQADTDPNYTPRALYMGYASYLQDILPKNLSGVDAGPARTADQLAWFDAWVKTVKVVVVRAPQHGRMVADDMMDTDQPSYAPDKGFVGKDQVDVLVSAKDAKGHVITTKLVYFINVTPTRDFLAVAENLQTMVKRYCGKNAPVWPIRK
ncbi:MAG: hypothetical protein EOP38_01005 [Rubrivivax sp.]|nr:MAG: hypothetical protein EOP38_01005 [Rubrivivax sp.]